MWLRHVETICFFIKLYPKCGIHIGGSGFNNHDSVWVLCRQHGAEMLRLSCHIRTHHSLQKTKHKGTLWHTEVKGKHSGPRLNPYVWNMTPSPWFTNFFLTFLDVAPDIPHHQPSLLSLAPSSRHGAGTPCAPRTSDWPGMFGGYWPAFCRKISDKELPQEEETSANGIISMVQAPTPTLHAWNMMCPASV